MHSSGCFTRGEGAADIPLPFGADTFGFALDSQDRILLAYTSGALASKGADFAVTRFDVQRVLGTSARKPPLSDTLLWATLN
jgi:hypothetical protein